MDLLSLVLGGNRFKDVVVCRVALSNRHPLAAFLHRRDALVHAVFFPVTDIAVKARGAPGHQEAGARNMVALRTAK
jgi:hypothetical protein